MLAPPPAAGPQADEIAWSLIEGTSDPKQLSAFLERFPRSALRPKAQARLDELSGRRTAALVPTPAPTSPSASEAIRSCDRLASHPDDPDRPADLKGVAFESIDAPAAVLACLEAVEAEPANRRLAFQLGRGLEASKSYGEARRWYERAALAGSPGAMSNLGLLYENGRGVPQNHAEAKRWFDQAASSRHQDAPVSPFPFLSPLAGSGREPSDAAGPAPAGHCQPERHVEHGAANSCRRNWPCAEDGPDRVGPPGWQHRRFRGAG